jgi:hypothetical protein
MSKMSELSLAVEIMKEIVMNDWADKYTELSRRYERLQDLLSEVCSYLEDRADMISDADGDVPNSELSLLSMIKEELQR